MTQFMTRPTGDITVAGVVFPAERRCFGLTPAGADNEAQMTLHTVTPLLLLTHW